MPQDFFAPGLPTQYEGRTKATLPQNPKDRMQALREWEQGGANPSTPANPYANEPSVDQLLTQSRGTLKSAGDFSRNNSPFYYPQEPESTNIGPEDNSRTATISKIGQEKFRRAPESSDMNAPNPEFTYKNAAENTLGALGFLPGPVGVGARGASSLIGLYDMAHEGPTLGNAMQVAAPIFDIATEGYGAAKAAKAVAPAGMPSRVWGALGGEEVAGSQFASKGGQIPPVRHYWDALDLGETPAKAAKIGAGRDKASMSALQSLQDAGKQTRSGPWEDLTGQVEDLADPLADVRSRASERFGKTYRSEGGNPGGSARSVPKPDMAYAGAGDEPVVTKDGIFDSAGRWLAPLAGSADDVAFAAMRHSRDPRR